MKKFLTVLLALSVVFTYTVGTAFAATPDEVSAEKTAMKSAVTTYAGKISYDSNGRLGSAPEVADPDKNLTKTAVEAVIAKVISKYEAEIIKADAAGTDLTDAWVDIDSDVKLAAVIFTDNAVDLYTRVIAEEVAALKAKVATYTVADYPQVNQAALEAAITDATTAIETAVGAVAEKATLTTLVAARDAFDGAVKDLKTKTALTTDLDTLKSKAKSNIASAASAFKTYAVSEYNKVIDNNNSTPSAVAEARARLNALDATIAMLTEMYGVQIDAVEYDETKAYTAADANKGAVDAVSTKAATTFSTTALTGYETAANALGGTTMLLEYAKVAAEQKKLEYDTSTGLAKYNPASVDKALADATASIYAGTTTTFVDVDGFFTTPNLQTAVAEKAALETKKKDAIDEITEAPYALSAWTGDNADRAKAIQDEYIAKIKVATTVADVTKLVTAAKAALDKVLKVADVSALETLTKTQMATLGYTGAAGAVGTKVAPQGLLMQHAVSLAAKNPTAYSDTLLQNTANAAVDFLVDKVVNNIDATKKTNALAIQTILKANYADALAIMSGLKTDAELDTAAKEVIATISALPTVVSLEARDQYVAAQKALEAYVNTPGAAIASITNSDLLKAYMIKLIALEKAAVEAKISALPKTITINDKEAIEAADVALKAYVDSYGKYVTGATYEYGYLVASNEGKLNTAKENLANAMLVDAAKKIAELPINVTAADKAAVEAARAAYDALTDEQKEAFSATLLKKLEASESQFVDAAIKATESLKIKTSTKLYKGKKIRVNWRVADGDASMITGYQVYKSTKANSGYKFMGKTKKMYMDNKKNLKKGKRYFYKVRAYVDVDGERYYSDWSNKGNRIYKK